MATSSPTGVQLEEAEPRKTRSQTEKERRKSEGKEESGETQSPSRRASAGKKRGRTPTSDGGTPKGKQSRKRTKQDEPLSPVAGSPKGKQSPGTVQPCSHADEGCEWTGTEKDLNAHLSPVRRSSKRNRQNPCKFAEVPCQFCNEKVPRKDLESHQSTCERRSGKCEHCKKQYPDFSEHSNKCRSFPVACPSGCGVSVPRKDLTAHQSQKCENRAVACSFHIAGCEDTPKLKDLEEHKKENKMEHLLLVQSHLAQNARRIQGKDASRFIELLADCLRHIAEASGDTGTIASVEQKLGEMESKHRELWDVVDKQREDVSSKESTVVEMHQATVSSQQEEIEKCQRECKEVRMEVEKLREIVQAQQEIIDKQREVISQQEAGSSAVSDRYQALFDAQAQEIQGCKNECASIREQLEESSAEKIRATTERNRGLLFKHTDMLIKQQAEITQHKKGLEDLEAKVKTATLPFEFTMTNVSRWRLNPDPFYSPPFYTHREGYRMCIRVYPEGIGPAYGNHISVYAYLMRGEYDHKLLWPFQGSVTVQMLNQVVNDNHCIATLNFAETSDPDVVGRVTGGDRAKYGLGAIHFLHQARLDTDTQRNTKFLDCNSLHFRVLRTSNVDASAHLLRRCRLLESFMTGVEPQLCIAPIEFTLTDYIQHKKQSGVWVSPAFFSHKRGYRMCLEVYPNGMQDAWGQYVSVYTCIMRGPFDSELKWPFRGNIPIEILNQVRDQDHSKGVILYSDSTSDRHANRVIRSERSIGNGIPLFLAHADLGPDNEKKVLFLHNNTLRIRIGEIVLKN